MLQRLRCKAGYHKYALDRMSMMFLEERDGILLYRIENGCVYCGHRYCDTIKIPMPIYTNQGRRVKNA